MTAIDTASTTATGEGRNGHTDKLVASTHEVCPYSNATRGTSSSPSTPWSPEQFAFATLSSVGHAVH